MTPSTRSKRCAKCGYYLDKRALVCFSCGMVVGSVVSKPDQTATYTALCPSCLALIRMLDPCVGWVRVTPIISGGYSAKFRFTSGIHTGHYVFWRGNQYELLTDVLQGLEGKVADVASGALRPSKDDNIY